MVNAEFTKIKLFIQKGIDKKQNSCYNTVIGTKDIKTQQKKRGKNMKVFIKDEKKIVTITFTYWEKGTSGFSDDGHWSGDCANDVLGDVRLPVSDAEVYFGTREDIDAMLDFLDEYAMDSEYEWNVSIEDEIVSDIYYKLLCED